MEEKKHGQIARVMFQLGRRIKKLPISHVCSGPKLSDQSEGEGRDSDDKYNQGSRSYSS